MSCDKCGKEPLTAKASLTCYKEIGYGQINDVLRTEFVPEIITNDYFAKDSLCIKHIQNIDKSMKVGNVHERLYRGIDPGTIVNNTVINRAYSSTSVNPDVVGSFGKAIITFIKPDGIKFHRFINDQNEHEILLERNTTFTITSKQNGMYYANIDKFIPVDTETQLNEFRAQRMKQLVLDQDDESSDFSVDND